MRAIGFSTRKKAGTPCLFYYLNIRLSRSSIVTPGIPAAPETPIVRGLSGKVTPVNIPVKFTAASAQSPVIIPPIAL